MDAASIDGLVFDLYGTLLEVSSVERRCAGVAPDPAAFVSLWRAKQLEYAFLTSLAQAYRDFDELTALALLHTPAGNQSAVDNAKATQLSDQAQVLQAQANLRLSSINLGYTDIRAPIGGKIGQTTVTIGNVVNPNSGTLATIVSQDPMYVTFPVSFRTALDLRDRYASKGGFDAVVIKVQLPNGHIYGQTGKVNFVNNTISASTDTIILRGTIPNPPIGPRADDITVRELSDGEFVNVILEGVEPIEALTVPRAAVLSDQAGDYVYVVNAENKVEQRRIQLGQSTPTTAVVMSGLREGEMVVVDGIQKVRPGQVVTANVVPGN